MATFPVVEEQAKEGVDFFRLSIVELLSKYVSILRLILAQMGIVSRGETLPEALILTS